MYTQFGNQRCRKKLIAARNQLCMIATLQNTTCLLLYLLHHSRNFLLWRSLRTVVSSPSLTQFSALEISTYGCIFSITHAIFCFGDLYVRLYLLHHSRNFLLWRSLRTVVSSPSLTQFLLWRSLRTVVSSPSLTQFSTLEISTYGCIFSITHAIFYFGDLYVRLYLLHHSRNFLLWRSLPTIVSSQSLMQFATWQITTYLLTLNCCIFSIIHPICYSADHYLPTFQSHDGEVLLNVLRCQLTY